MIKRLELIAGIVLAIALFVVLKLLGLVIKLALVAAMLGFIAGILLWRAFRSRKG